jgi:hypothetical protein
MLQQTILQSAMCLNAYEKQYNLLFIDFRLQIWLGKTFINFFWNNTFMVSNGLLKSENMN